MHLIVDSGSTKSDWVLLDGNANPTFSTIGLNPHFHTSDAIALAVRENQGLFDCRDKVEHVFFYGAGCSSEAASSIVRDGLSSIFISAKITVDHDLKACALATYQNEAAIACILGTGSNSCFFDGKQLIEEVPSLGYVLGDEGSGAYFGKKLVVAYLYGQLPEKMSESLAQIEIFDKDLIIQRVYKESNTNTFLASFMKYVYQFSDEVFIQEMILAGFKEFIEIHVCCFEAHKKCKVHFIGSVAFLFQVQLKQACEQYGISLGQVVQKPIDGLIEYHLSLL